MSAILNLKPRSSTSNEVLKSEYAGVDSSGVYYPKCIQNLKGTELKIALRGLLIAWTNAQSSRGVLLAGTVNLDIDANPEFYEFLLLFWISRFNQDLATKILPIFKSHRECDSFMKGQVDLVAFDRDCEISFPGFICEFSELSYDLPYFKVLKDGYREVLTRLGTDLLLADDLFSVVCQGLEILRHIPTSSNPFANAFEVALALETDISVVLPAKVQNLSEPIRFFSEFIIREAKGINPGSATMNGVLFNLNYLLEYVLRKALRSTYTDFSVQKKLFSDNRINRISVVRGDESIAKKQMQPDCLGVFSSFKPHISEKIKNAFDGKIYIFDAKHKVFSGDNDLGINRNDFYQIVSYSTTHYNIEQKAGIYGLVGLELQDYLIQNKDFASREYVGLNKELSASVIRIDSDRTSVEVLYIPIRFGQFLYDLGAANESEIELLYARLGENILQASNELQEAKPA